MAKRHQSEIISALLERGWTPAGFSREETVKLVTRSSYPFAGALVKLGGRPKFQAPIGGWFVTVGPVSTFFFCPQVGVEYYKWPGKRLVSRDVAAVLSTAKEVAGVD